MGCGKFLSGSQSLCARFRGLRNSHFYSFVIFFFYTQSWLSPKGDSLPFAGGSHRTKRYKRKIHSHSHSLITTAQTLLGTPGEVQPHKLSAFRSSWRLVTPRTPNKTPLQDNNFQRSPTGGPDPPSYRVESVSLPTLHHTILSVKLLHASRSKHTSLAAS